MTAPNIRTVDALTGERAPEKFFRALAEADALRAENEELRCRVDELTEELGELRLQLDERLRELSEARSIGESLTRQLAEANRQIYKLERGQVKL